MFCCVLCLFLYCLLFMLLLYVAVARVGRLKFDGLNSFVNSSKLICVFLMKLCMFFFWCVLFVVLIINVVDKLSVVLVIVELNVFIISFFASSVGVSVFFASSFAFMCVVSVFIFVGVNVFNFGVLVWILIFLNIIFFSVFYCLFVGNLYRVCIVFIVSFVVSLNVLSSRARFVVLLVILCCVFLLNVFYCL